ncbi:Cof-type HAD-IIB family hydrolase [Lachnospiraceae bacterium 45-W7]
MHTQNSFRLAALDLDGTLFNSQSQVSNENKSAIKDAIDKGTTFVISTGRPYSGLPLELMEELGIRYAITTNGAAVYKVPEKECLFETCIPASLASDILKELLQLNIHINLFLHGDAYAPAKCRQALLKIRSLPDSIKEYMLTTRTSIKDMPAFLREQEAGVQKMTLNFPEGEDNSFPDRGKAMEILDKYPQVSYLCGGYHNLEFTMTGISKGKGLALLCQYLDIPIDHTLACGDSENDLDIMKTAGLGVAMANAPREIQALADDITLSNDEHGVAAMIRKWL